MNLDFQTLGVAVAIFVAAFTQAVTGFGSALVAMPLLAQFIGVKTGAPLMALISLAMNAGLLLFQRQSFRWRAVWQLILAAVIAIPLGILTVDVLSERVVLFSLGVLLVSYALYAWFAPHLPRLTHPAWQYLFGVASGILAGAYNVGGPPAVIYAGCKRWDADEFRSNLQALFLVENIFVLVGHTAQGNLTQEVLGLLWTAVPALVIGLAVGIVLDRYIPDALFRRLVLVLLVVLGIKLLLG
jgi:uncharacterized membrane protein YfcA